MLPFKLIYSDDYFLPIGSHVFPAEKYRRVHDQLIKAGVADPSDFITPQPASDQDILLVTRRNTYRSSRPERFPRVKNRRWRFPTHRN